MPQKEFWILTFAIGCLLSCKEYEEETLNILAGGKTTVFVENSNSFQFPAPNLTIEELEQHRLGDQAFEAIFVTAPATNNSGLGPLFNQSACASCHPKNGRSVFSDNPGDLAGLLFRLSITGKGPHGEPLAVPGFGGQLQTKANLGKQAEAFVNYQFKFINGTFDDGELYELRQAIFSLTNSYIPIPGGTLISPRMAPPVFGLGLLEFISESEILKNEDIQDSNGDGISGKANWVWDFQKSSM
ncbi:MAG: di-heme oxidoredictase family protein, partial [Saprospiraceae bacterium]